MQKPNQQLSQEERAKRQAVFFKKPDTILVKFYDWETPLWGLNKICTAELEKRRAAMDAEAAQRGLDPHAYRGKKRDTGLQVLAKEANISLSSLYEEMKANGYAFVRGELFTDETKSMGSIVTLVFELNGDPAPEPEWIAEAMTDTTFYLKALWANLNYAEDDSSVRVDTVNVNRAKPRPDTRNLHMHGNTYRITRPR